jgi:RpiB/LacA/LacB family sugar-phosphate isomerase
MTTIAISADHDMGAIKILPEILTKKGFQLLRFGAFSQGQSVDNWAEVSRQAAQAVADGQADSAIVCCFTGTGASISANKVSGIRAALCLDSFTANGARKWNNANVLAISIRLTTETMLAEIVDAWFNHEPVDQAQLDNINYINHIC